ncbi:MAG: hypothetical protein ACFFCS_13520 [Candidatus Hodarchaeota archaeon]
MKNRQNRLLLSISLLIMSSTFILTSSSIFSGVRNQRASNDGDDIIILGDGLNSMGTSSILSDNSYSGDGMPLVIHEWGDSTNVTDYLSLIDSQVTTADIKLAESWTGYALNTYVYDLFETECWVAFDEFTPDGVIDDNINNGVWTFGRNMTDDKNTEIGGEESGGGEDYVWVDINPNNRAAFNVDEHAWWIQNVTIPRGTIVEAWVVFDYWTGDVINQARCPYSDFNIYAGVNGQRVFNIGSPDMAAENTWGTTGIRQVSQSIIDSLPSTPGSISFEVGAYCSTTWNAKSYNMYARFDNARFFVKALARPSDVNLTVDISGDDGGRYAIPDDTYGNGTFYMHPSPANWTAPPVGLNITSDFRTNATTDFPEGLEIVEFAVEQTIYGTHPRNTKVGATLLANDGSRFVATNGSDVNWTSYFYDRAPVVTGNQDDYIHYLFNGTKPSDWDIYSIIDSQPVEKISFLSGAGNGSTFIEMPESEANYYGFWSISATSPNYVQAISCPTEVNEGEYLNISGGIISSVLTDGYVDETNAVLTIKYPNGTIWDSATQVKTVLTNRSVAFDPIFITDNASSPEYVGGQFTAILSWNNSRLGVSPVNETGVAVAYFEVHHGADISAENDNIKDILNTETQLPLQIRYKDRGGADIPDANVTFMNFEGVNQSFSYTGGYYNYLTLLDCTNASVGNNTLEITARSPSYETLRINITVEIVRTASFSIAEFPSAVAQWDQNITLTLNYTDEANGSPIVLSSPDTITVDWEAGYYWVNMSENASGIYYLVLNTSQKFPGNSYLINIKIKETGHQGKTLLMDITITPRLSALIITPVPTLAFGELLDIDLYYRDSVNSSPITNVSGRITGTARILETNDTCLVQEIGGGYYNITLDTWLLTNLGTYNVEVNWSWTGQPFYANHSTTTQFELVNRTTQAYTSGTYDVQSWNSLFNVSLFYVDTVNGSSINGSNVNIIIDAWDNTTSLTDVNTLTNVVYDSNLDAWQLEFNSSHFGRTNLNLGFLVNVYVNWTSDVAPYYINRSLSFTIRVDEAPTFLYIENPQGQTVPAGENHTIIFTWINQRDGSPILDAHYNITVNSSVLPNSIIYDPSWSINYSINNGSYVLTFNISGVPADYVSFNISISRQNYQDVVDYSLTLIKITEIPVIELMYVDQVHLGQEMNITLFYHLQGSPLGIENASVYVSNDPSSNYWTNNTDYTYSYNGSYYNVTFTPSLVHAHANSEGAYTIFVNMSSTKGVTKIRVNFNVDPIPSNISQVFIDSVDKTGVLPSENVYIGDIVNLTLIYEDTFSSVPIADASITLTLGAWSDPFVWNITHQQYTLMVNTSVFSVGPATFTATAVKGNYTQTLKQIQLNILSVSTNLSRLLNFVDFDPIQVSYGENITVSALYMDTHNNVILNDSGVSISLTGGLQAITGGRWTLNGSYWQVEVNTTELGSPGTYAMTMTAGLTNYQTALVTFVIIISSIPTELKIYDSLGVELNQLSVYWGETFDIAAIYNNTITGVNITGATVATSGTITNSSYGTDGYWYNFTFDSSTFGIPKVYTITLSGSKDNHTSSSDFITVTVLPIPTELRVYNGTISTTSFDQVYGGNVTIKVQLYDTLNNVSILAINLTSDYGTISPVGGEPGNYTVEINTTDWASTGIKQFTITGQQTNYVASSELITLNIQNLPTDILVYIDGQDRTSSLQETIDYLDVFNITIYLNDAFNISPVTGATVSILFTNMSGTYQFNLTAIGGQPGNYSILLDSDELGSANQYIFSLSAVKPNYDSYFAKINIFLNPIPTALNVTHNSTLLNDADTISTIYGDTVLLDVALISYLESSALNGSNTTVEIYTILNGTRKDAFWNGTIETYQLEIITDILAYDLDAGFPHVITVYGEAAGYVGDDLSFVLFVDVIPTNLSVSINGTTVQDFKNNNNIYLRDTLNITVQYHTSYGTLLDLVDYGGVVTLTYENKTGGDETFTLTPNNTAGYFIIDNFYIDDTKLNAERVNLYITAELDNYQTLQYTLIIDIEYIPTSLDVFVDGQNITSTAAADINATAIFNVTAYYYSTHNVIANITGADVAIMENETGNFTMNPIGARYEVIIDEKALSPSSTQYVFTLVFQDSSFETQNFRFYIFTSKISSDLVITGLNLTDDTQVVNWSETITFNCQLNDTLNEAFVKASETTFLAIVGSTIYYNASFSPVDNETVQFLIDTRIMDVVIGGTTLITIRADHPSYQLANFIFNLDTRKVISDLVIVGLNLTDGTQKVNWSDTIVFNCSLNDTLNDALIEVDEVTFTATIGSTVFYNASFIGIDNETVQFTLNTTKLDLVVGGTTLITIRAEQLNYTTANYLFNLDTRPIETKLNYSINGVWQSDTQPFPEFVLGSTLEFIINYTTLDGTGVDGHDIMFLYDNDITKDSLNITANSTGLPGQYGFNLTLDLNTFYGQQQFFFFKTQFENYTSNLEEVSLVFRKINIVTVVTLPDEININERFWLYVDLWDEDNNRTFDYHFNLSQIDIRLSTSIEYGGKSLENLENGTFRIQLTATSFGKTIYEGFDISTPGRMERQYRFETAKESEFSIVVVQEGGVDPIWIVIMVIALAAVIVYFLAYHFRLKYPPIVRKIHDLERSIRKGKPPTKIKTQKVSSRDENFYSMYADIINDYAFLKTKESIFAQKKKGYKAKAAEEQPDTIAEEYGLKVVKPPTEIKPAAPKKLPTIGPKKALTPPVDKGKAEVKKPSKPPKVTEEAKVEKPSKVKEPEVGAKIEVDLKAPPKPKPIPVPAARRKEPKPFEDDQNLYAQLVKLEQRKYKAQRSIRDLNAKMEKGILTKEEYEQYREKFQDALKRVENKIAELRRRLMNF